MNIKIRAYMSPDDLEMSHRYVEEYRKVLEAYGIKKVTSTAENWMSDPNTCVIIVTSPDDERIYGGCRLQVRTAGLRLPMEDAIARVDPRIYAYMDKFNDKKIAELAGLFNAKEVAGYGIGSTYLGRIAVALSTQLNIDYLMGLSAPPTYRNSAKVGFEIMRELGNNGKYYYPKEGLIATSVVIWDLINLPVAPKDERQLIFNLRENPNQIAFDSGPKGVMEIHYQLSLTKNEIA
jgi:hypothetical protein